MGLWIPPKLSRELEDLQNAHNAQVAAAMELREELEPVDRELKAIDPLLELAFFPENGDPFLGLKPNRFHILRHNHNAPVTAEVLEHPDGSPMEPGCSAMWQMLERSDMWSNRTQRKAQEVRRKAADAYARAQAREAEARADEINERIASAERESILFTDDVKFKAKAGARVPA